MNNNWQETNYTNEFKKQVKAGIIEFLAFVAFTIAMVTITFILFGDK